MAWRLKVTHHNTEDLHRVELGSLGLLFLSLLQLFDTNVIVYRQIVQLIRNTVLRAYL